MSEKLPTAAEVLAEGLGLLRSSIMIEPFDRAHLLLGYAKELRQGAARPSLITAQEARAVIDRLTEERDEALAVVEYVHKVTAERESLASRVLVMEHERDEALAAEINARSFARGLEEELNEAIRERDNLAARLTELEEKFAQTPTSYRFSATAQEAATVLADALTEARTDNPWEAGTKPARPTARILPFAPQPDAPIEGTCRHCDVDIYAAVAPQDPGAGLKIWRHRGTGQISCYENGADIATPR